MNNSLLNTIETFLKRYCSPHTPILLAFSGGPDSLTLLHFLLTYRQNNPSFSFALAHVDHGWRAESAQEAQSIADLAKMVGVTAHFKTLIPQELHGNLEAACREERLQFFAHLCQTHGYQGVMLAHHADDLAETVLKRVLEGVALPYLCGMRLETEIKGMKVWRPFLNIEKKKLITWLSSQGLKGIEDATNLDPKFMRGRFRTRILPDLSKEFGKEIAPRLCQLSQESGELRDYLNQRVARFLDKITCGTMGSMLDLGQECPESLFEIKYLIRRFCELSDFHITHNALDNAMNICAQGLANKQVVIGNKTFYLDRRRLLIPKMSLPPLPKSSLSLVEGENVCGNWVIDVTRVAKKTPHALASDWRGLWNTQAQVILPMGEYEIAYPHIKQPYSKTTLGEWWSKHKIPTFLRMLVPVVSQQGVVCHEFLAGTRPPLLRKGPHLCITIRFCRQEKQCDKNI